MVVVSNDPVWWPTIDLNLWYSYFVVASSTVVVYDWALTFAKEVDLVWRQRWSLMTLLYLNVRYIGIISSVISMGSLPIVSLTDIVSNVVYQTQAWASYVANSMLCVIMVIRLHAMYQQSRKMFIFLIAATLAVNVACGVICGIVNSSTSGEELILSGSYLCSYGGYEPLLWFVAWALATAWEVIALCLAAWIAIKHFRELQQRPTGWAIRDCLMVLIKSHMIYFAGFTVIDCFTIGHMYPMIWKPSITGVLQIPSFAQIVVLGPRLILSVREYHAELVVNSDSGTGMTAIAFQAGIPVSIDGDV